MRADPIRKSWSSRCRISRIRANTWVHQEELLVARDKRQYQEIYLRIYQVLTKQSTTHEESRRTSSIGNTGRIMAGN